MGAIELIEVIIGLVFVVLILSIIVALINEIIVTNFKVRSKLLKKSIARLLDDSKMDEVLGDNFYAHPLIRKLTKSKRILPSYISASTFSKVLVDVLKELGDKSESVNEAINKLPEDSETRIALLTLLNDANNDMDKFKNNVEEWFNESMARLSGWYKRYTQIQLFIIGFILAVVLNVNCIHIAKELSDNKEKRLELVEAAREYTRSRESAVEDKKQMTLSLLEREEEKMQIEELTTDSNKIAVLQGQIDEEKKEIEMLRDSIDIHNGEMVTIRKSINQYSGLVGIFWEGEVRTPGELIAKISKEFHISWLIGWFITALAASLGSSFWFDLLKKLINVRGSGKSESSN